MIVVDVSHVCRRLKFELSPKFCAGINRASLIDTATEACAFGFALGQNFASYMA